MFHAFTDFFLKNSGFLHFSENHVFDVFEKLGPGTNTKHKSKGEALGQNISLNLDYPHTHHQRPTHKPRKLIFGRFFFFLKSLALAQTQSTSPKAKPWAKAIH